jgi:hypothetical protein
MTLQKGVFYWDGMGRYEGYSGNILWNGWECPLFPIGTAIQILRDSPEVLSFSYDKLTNKLSVKTEWNTEEHPFEFVEGVSCEVNPNTPMLLFPILDGWCWYKEDQE